MATTHTSRRTPPISDDVTRVKARSAEDVVAATPYLMGYEISNSVVVLMMNHGRTRGGFRVKIPIEAYDNPRELRELADTLAGIINPVKEVTEVAVLLYTPQSIAHGQPAPGAHLINRCTRAIESGGTEVMYALIVSDESWTEARGPAEPRPLPTPESSATSRACAETADAPLLNIDKASELPKLSPVIAESEVPASQGSEAEPLDAEQARALDRKVLNAFSRELRRAGEKSPASPDDQRLLIAALQEERHWLHCALALLFTPAHFRVLQRKCLSTHGMAIREFLMTRNSTLISQEERQRGTLVIVRETSAEPPEPGYTAQAQQALANLAAASPRSLRAHIEAMRALAWWWAGTPGIAAEVLENAPKCYHDATSVCPRAAVADLFDEEPLPLHMNTAEVLSELFQVPEQTG